MYLLNAILGRSGAVATSGLRACTAVPIEVERLKGSAYCAQVVFFSPAQYADMLRPVLLDLSTPAGRIHKSDPGEDHPNASSWTLLHKIVPASIREVFGGHLWARTFPRMFAQEQKMLGEKRVLAVLPSGPVNIRAALDAVAEG